MASIGSPPVEHAPKPSFAKVAASSYMPSNSKDFIPNTHSSNKQTQSQPPQQNTNTTLASDMSHEQLSVAAGNNSPSKSDNPDVRTERWAANNDPQTQSHAVSAGSQFDSGLQPRGTAKHNATDDNSTQLSSSDGSVKPPSLDGKSIASGTTFALDEKESLRPDDSASLRAVEEEDGVSPPGSVAPGSRIGSDVGGNRAFRDQLNEIATMGPAPHRGVPPGRFQQGVLPAVSSLYQPGHPIDAVRNLPGPVVNGTNPVVAAGSQSLPDEKLLDALESARDRVWVLKLEQDFIDFVKDPGQTELNLPNCNAFYRMLAHRLADYFLLGHMVDESMTAVRISKTSYCRIPPPLSGFTNPSSAVNTPPLEVPTRKIMRRGDASKIASGTSTTANSEGPSKAGSEAGGNVSDGIDDVKTKATLTREEREAKYKEARQRIFGDAEASESPTGENINNAEDKEMSRSSSAAGKKKSKKQRNYNDDGFEARSQFNAYYAPAYGATTYTPDNPSLMYVPYPGMMAPGSYPVMQPNMAAPMGYGNSYAPVIPQDGPQPFGWTQQQTFQPTGQAMPYNMAMPVNYEQLPADFQRGMQSFQSAPNMTPQMSKASVNTMGTPPAASYMDPTRPPTQQVNQAWPQPNQQPTYPPMQPQFTPSGTAPSAATPPMFQTPYAYGQLPPASPYSNGRPNNQHPIPGSYNGNFQRAQFNPQTQAFVPGGARQGSYGMPAQAQLTPPNIGGWGNAPFPNGPQMQVPRVSPPIHQASTFGSPRSPLVANSANLPVAPMSNNRAQPIAAPNPASAQLSTSSLPVQSTIAKWGTPSHLPPKPPPTVSMQATKFALPGHNLPAAAHLPANVNSNGLYSQNKPVAGAAINGRQ